ncbi:hypothetical protein CK203_054859 [Vitis vinifera]|uniref:Uncharacterized protein n=1 Tax=Vitis vinifera TaxID=29760 RepID=A0A438GAW5_VITVI|nr:hypothetical protein CK203_054859 [Vitis vinifera]
MQYQIQECTSWLGFVHFNNGRFPAYILIIASNVGALRVQMLRSLKDAFWPFQHDNTRSLFLRAAHAANCIDRSNIVTESGFELASAKAAQHRLERGVWTSVRFGDMRRALSGVRLLHQGENSKVKGKDERSFPQDTKPNQKLAKLGNGSVLEVEKRMVLKANEIYWRQRLVFLTG